MFSGTGPPYGGPLDESSASKLELERLNAERRTSWVEEPLESWFDGCLPGRILPENIKPDTFQVDFGHQEPGMYPGWVSLFEISSSGIVDRISV